MDRSVTLEWLNCLSQRRAKIKRLSDSLLVDYLFDLLIKFQFCTQENEIYPKAEKQELISKFLTIKNKDYDVKNLFNDEDELLIACWIFLIHIVWSLEDATLRNHLSFHLGNSSQLFIKTFLESVQEESEISRGAVSRSLSYACEKCAHLELTTEEYVSNSSLNSTPNNQTPTGIKRKMSLTLREFFQSPNSQKKFVEEHTKEIKRLKTELNSEIMEKMEVLDDNTKLREKVDTLNKQLQTKLNENEKLKEEIREIESNFNNFVRIPCERSAVEEKEMNELKMKVSELQDYVRMIENENENARKDLLSREKNLKAIIEEFNSLRIQFAELELTLVTKEETLLRVQQDKEFFKTEVNNLKEYNQVLNEKIQSLESCKQISQPRTETLESELQYQLMKDSIDCMTKNFTIIENEQTRLVSENQILSEQVKNLTDEKKEIDFTLRELNSRIDTLKNENNSLKSSKENLNKKLKQTESKLSAANRDLETAKAKQKSLSKKITEEKEALENEIRNLKQELQHHSLAFEELRIRENRLISDNQQVANELEQTRHELSVSENRLAECTFQIENLKSEKISLSKKITDFENTNKSLNNKIADLSKEKSKSAKHCDELEKKINSYKETIESLVKQVSTEQDRSKEMTQTLEVYLRKVEETANSLKRAEEEKTDFSKRIDLLNEQLKFTESRYKYETEAHDKAKTKLDQIQQINVDQKTRLDDLEKDIKNKSIENKTLSCKIKDLETLLREVENDNKKLKESLTEANKENEKRAKKYAELEEKANVDQIKVQSLDDQLAALREQHDNLIQEANALARKLQIERNQAESLEDENENLKRKCEEFSEEVARLLALYHHEREVNEQLNMEFVTVQGQVVVLNNTLEEVRNENKTLNESIAKITRDNEQLLEEKNNVTETVKSLESQIPPLTDEITVLRTRIDDLNNANDSLKSRLTDLSSELKTAESEKVELITKCESLEAQIKHLEDDHNNAKESTNVLVAKLSQLGEVNEDQQVTIKRLQNDLNTMTVAHTKLEARFRNSDNQTIELRSHLEELEEKSKNLQNEKNLLTEDVTRLQTYNVQLDANLNELGVQRRREREQYEAKIAALNEDIEETRIRLEEMNRSSHTQLEQLKTTEDRLKKNQLEKEALQKEYSSLMREKDRIQSDYENETQLLKSKIADLEKLDIEQRTRTETLENDYRRTSEENARLGEQLKDLENNIFEVQERLKACLKETDTLRSEKVLLLEKIVAFEKTFDEIQSSRETLLQTIDTMTAEKKSMLDEHEQLQKVNLDNESVIESLTARIARLCDENKSYEEELESLEDVMKSLNEENKSLKEKYAKLREDLTQLQSDHQNVVNDNTALNSEIGRLEEINIKQNQTIDELKNSLENEKNKLATVETELANTLRLKDDENSAIKDENQRLTEENRKYLATAELLEQLRTEKIKLLETLEAKETQLNEINTKWHDELDTMKKERTRDAEKIDRLLADCENLKKTIAELENELSVAQNRYDELLKELREMFLLQIQQILDNNESLKNENLKLFKSNQDKSWYLKEMHKRIEPILKAAEELEKKIQELKDKNDTLTREIEECNGNKWKIKTENEHLTALVCELEKEKEILSKEVQNLKDEKELLNFRIDELKLDNEEAKNDADTLRKLIRKDTLGHQTLKDQAEKLTEDLKKLRRDFDDKNEENDKLKQLVEQRKEEVEKEINAKNHELEKCHDALKEICNQLENLRSEKEELRKDNEKLLQERNAMLDQKIIFEQENAKIKHRLEELTTQKNELYNINEINSKTFENRLQSMMYKNDEQLIQIQNLKGENEVLRNEINAVKNTASASSRKQLEGMEKCVQELSKANLELNEKHEVQKKEIESLSEANHRLQVKLEKQISTNASLESKIRDYDELFAQKEASTKRIEELKTKIDELLEQNERSSDELNKKCDSYTAMLKENEKLLARVDKLETTHSKLEKEYDSLLGDHEKLKQVHGDVCNKIDSLNDIIGQKEKEILLVKDEYRIFKDEYRKIIQHKDEMEKDWKESLVNECKNVSTKYDELKEINNKITEELNEKNQMLANLEAEIEKIKSLNNETNLNETHIVASGSNNKTEVILNEENRKMREESENLKKKVAAMKTMLEHEKEMYRQKSQKLYDSLNNKILAEYEGKLTRAKADYNKIMTQKFSAKESEWKKKEEEYQKLLRKEKEHIRDLSSQLWDMNDKYLSLKQNSKVKESPCDFRRNSVDSIFSPGTLMRRAQSATHLNSMDSRMPKALDFDRRLSTMSEDIHFHGRNRKHPPMTSAKVFPTEDEEMEIFDNACLADLKQGRMAGDDSDFHKQRLSVLQARNSLCPPHLKSSYPAETQFLPPQEFKENDIKMGIHCENDHSDIENLLPSERSRKNRNQTSYKKPGPPTPSKHGGRSTNIETDTPRNVLKEPNDNGNARRKSFTPRLFNFFPIRGHATVTAAASQPQPQDENSTVTPKRTRLQSIRRRFSKNHQELGSTNSGFC